MCHISRLNILQWELTRDGGEGEVAGPWGEVRSCVFRCRGKHKTIVLAYRLYS